MVDVGTLVAIAVGYVIAYGLVVILAVALWRLAFGRRGRRR